MPENVVIKGILIVIFITFIVFMVEYFVPVAAKVDMNTYCRATLIEMDSKGGLDDEDKNELLKRLSERGFTNIVINGSTNVQQGQEMTLSVEADYTFSKLFGLYVRSDLTQHMSYSKTSISRKVIN